MRIDSSKIILLLLLVISPTAPAQNKPADVVSLDTRLQRVERILDNRVLLDMLQRIEQVQQEVRSLRGEIERLDYELRSMNKRQRDLYLDTDRRLQALESDSGGLFGLGDIDAEADTLQADQQDTAGPSTEKAAAKAPSEQRDSLQPGEKDAYDKAYNLLISGNNTEAVSAFNAFIDKYPDGPYTDNAWYWTGEANYVLRKFDVAIQKFRVVTESFPSSAKVPDALLKTAYAMYEMGEVDESRASLESLMQNYPASSAARLAKRRLTAMTAESTGQ